MGELGFPTLTNEEQSSVLNTKRMIYCLYLLFLPMNIPYCWSLFLLAATLSFLERNNIIGNSPGLATGMLGSFVEEECMNIFLMVFLIPSGWMLKIVIHVCLCIWALVHVSMLADCQLRSDPNTIGLSALKPIIDYIVHSKVEFITLKNQIEILIGLSCAPLVLIGKAAMIFPILFFQYIRIKYVSN